MLTRMNCPATLVLVWAGVAAGEGMVARYEFENNVLDSAGSAHGTVIGSPSYVAGKYGQAIHLDHFVDTVTFAGVPVPPAVSVSVWVRLDPATPAGRYWFLDHLASSPWRGWQIKTEKLTGTSGQLLWMLADDDGNRKTTAGPANALYDGQWHHIAGTHDGVNTAQLYFDGIQLASTTGSLYVPPPSTRGMTLINRSQNPYGSGINEVDDLAIWNRALSSLEILDLFDDRCMNVAPNLISRYHVSGSGGAVSPAVFTVTNLGSPGLTYTVQEAVDQPWLTLNKAGGGPLPYGAADAVTATIHSAGLPVGVYVCDIWFINNCSPTEQTTVRVSLGVESQPQIPFVISYYDNGWMSLPATDTGYSTLAACGMNVVNSSLGKSPPIDLDLAQQYGLRGMVDWSTGGTEVIPDNPPLIESKAQSLVSQYSYHPALLGYRLRDEPSADEWPQLGLLHQKLLEYDPTCLPWINILPNYSYGAYGAGVTSHKQYMDTFMSTVQPKVLCYDDYTVVPNTTYPPNVYSIYWHYSNLERFREYGLAYHIPCWKIIESNLTNTSPNTEGIFRFQIYSALAYGFTGILYFTYTQQNESDYAFAYYQNQAGLWGTPTNDGRYYVAQTIHNEVKKLAPVLSNLTSWSVHHTNPNMTPPVSVPAEDRETFNGVDNFYVTSIAGGDMVYGQFVTNTYRTYVMFVNQDYVSGHTFAIRLKAANVAGLGRVSKTTGRLDLVSTPSSTLSLPLSAGNGELYKVLLDTTAASTPANLIGTPRSATQVFVDWPDSTDAESGITHYVVYRDGVEIATATHSAYTDTGLVPETTYQYEVSSVNGEGVESAKSAPILVTLASSPADFDRDGDVDDVDATLFEVCNSGPATPYAEGCNGKDLDADGDVDQSDFGIVQRCFSGAAAPADPDCAD